LYHCMVTRSLDDRCYLYLRARAFSTLCPPGRWASVAKFIALLRLDEVLARLKRGSSVSFALFCHVPEIKELVIT
jgi:hypothetical protein